MCLKQLDVNKITFFDEKRFLLDGPDGCRYYWHKIGPDRRVFGKKKFSRGLTVWAGIGFGATINSEKYQEIIQQYYLPFHQPGFLLAQDNAPCHVSAASRQFMAERNIALLDWAAHSPDCNPIENLWGNCSASYLPQLSPLSKSN